jgi:hypothetical protein
MASFVNYSNGTPSGSVLLTSYEKEMPAEKPVHVLTAAEKDAQDQERFRQLQSALYQNRNYDSGSRICTELASQIEAMLASGFVPAAPKVPEKKSVVAPPPIKRFEPPTLREEFNIPDKVSCPVCGELIPGGNLASHTRDLDNEVCILDSERVRKSGRFPSWRLAELIELAATTKAARAKEKQV